MSDVHGLYWFALKPAIYEWVFCYSHAVHVEYIKFLSYSLVGWPWFLNINTIFITLDEEASRICLHEGQYIIYARGMLVLYDNTGNCAVLSTFRNLFYYAYYIIML